MALFDVLEPARFPKLIWMDTNDPEFGLRMANFLQQGSLTRAAISECHQQSGGTMETIANAEFLLSVLEPLLSTYGIVWLLLPTKFSACNNSATKQITTLTIPKTVGGRYSVLSQWDCSACSVAVDIQEFRRGAALCVLLTY